MSIIIKTYTILGRSKKQRKSKEMGVDTTVLILSFQLDGGLVYLVFCCQAAENFEEWPWVQWYFQNGFPEGAVFDNIAAAHAYAAQLEVDESPIHGVVTNNIHQERNFPLDVMGNPLPAPWPY